MFGHKFLLKMDLLKFECKHSSSVTACLYWDLRSFSLGFSVRERQSGCVILFDFRNVAI